eukprot:jgi/Mesvir1/17774/Mv19011-RA.1
MLAVFSAVAIAGYVLRPTTASKPPRAADTDLEELDMGGRFLKPVIRAPYTQMLPMAENQTKYPAPVTNPDCVNLGDSLGYPMVPLYTSRGGYGPAEPDYLSAPGAIPGMGRNSSLLKMHVEPPKDKRRRKTEFKKTEENELWKKSRPGAEPMTTKPVVETQQFHGRFTSDRRRGYDNTLAATGTRSHLLPNVKDNLIVNYMTPDPTFIIAKPNPQQAQIDQPKLSVHLDGLRPRSWGA